MAKYLKTKEGSLEQAVLEAVKNSPAQIAAIASNKKQSENNYIHAARMAKEKGEKTFTIGGKDYDVEEALNTETNKNDKSDDGKGLDAVQPKAVKKKFNDRKDKDIDNDGDTDSSDEFLHKKRKAISKAMSKEEVELDEAFSPKDIKMAIGVASDKRYAGGNMSGAVSAIEKIKKGLSNHPQVMAVLKRQNESLVDKAARHITDMWKEAAAAKDRTEADEKCEDCGTVHEGACSESKDNSTMTGKTAAKVEVNPSENKAK